MSDSQTVPLSQYPFKRWFQTVSEVKATVAESALGIVWMFVGLVVMASDPAMLSCTSNYPNGMDACNSSYQQWGIIYIVLMVLTIVGWMMFWAMTVQLWAIDDVYKLRQATRCRMKFLAVINTVTAIAIAYGWSHGALHQLL